MARCVLSPCLRSMRAGKVVPRRSRCGRRRRGHDRGGGVRHWRRQDFGCWRVGLVAMMPRVDCPMRGVVVFCQIFVGRFGVSFSPFERLFLGRFGFGQSCGLSVIA